MTRIRASILVTAPFKNDERMYPHLHDVLVNLRKHYDEVIYVEDEMQYWPHNIIDRWMLYYLNSDDLVEQRTIQGKIKEAIGNFEHSRSVYVDKLKSIAFKNSQFIVLAIDDNAFNVSMEVFPGNTIYWSFDALGKDCPFRLNIDGFVERMIRENSQKSCQAKALIVQDTSRGTHLIDCINATFSKTIYVPVSLNDTTFCAIAALKRGQERSLQTLKIVQSGHICTNRYSDAVARSYQGWPYGIELYFRGNIGSDVLAVVEDLAKPVNITRCFYDNNVLPIIFNDYDVGFIGHQETDRNHHLIINASSQLAAYMRLGMPVLCCGSEQLISYVNDNKIGFATHHPLDIHPEQITDLVENYSIYSQNARKLFEEKYDLNRHMTTALYPELDCIFNIV